MSLASRFYNIEIYHPHIERHETGDINKTYVYQESLKCKINFSDRESLIDNNGRFIVKESISTFLPRTVDIKEDYIVYLPDINEQFLVISRVPIDFKYQWKLKLEKINHRLLNKV